MTTASHPRPDLSTSLGTPNTCNDCHADKTADWASAAIERWFGPERKGFQTYAKAFHAARSGGADAARLLGEIAADGKVPSIARASALAELASLLSPANIDLARAGLRDPDPMVRIGAIDMLDSAPANQLWALVSPLLADPVGGVRIRAVALLANMPTTEQPSADRERFERAAGEFVAAQRLNADRPEARMTLGSFLARTGRGADAEAEYRAALRIDSTFVPAAVNLADLYRQLARDADGVTVLRAALVGLPTNAELHHALGLALIRTKQADGALAELRRASELEPERARYAYVFAVALHSTGRGGEALKVLKAALLRHRDDRDILMALTSFSGIRATLPARLPTPRDCRVCRPTRSLRA
jgi:Flp pilus assembly protein TadD